MGRPLLRECELRTRVDVYLTEAERVDISRRAVEARLPLSMFIRRSALGQRIVSVPAGNTERWVSLSRLAANLNQIARYLNSGAVAGFDADVIGELLEEVRGLRLDLLGEQKS